MKTWMMLAAGAVVLAIVAVGALVFLGIWPGPSAADRQQARLLTMQAETQLRNNNQEAALTALNSAIHAAPDDAALRMRASIFVARNNFTSARADMDKLIGHGEGQPGDFALRCWLRARGDDLGGARGDCDRSIALNPALPNAYGNRGLIELKQLRFNEAWEDFNTAMRIGGSDQWLAWRLFGRGAAAWGRGRNVEGRQDVEMALHSNPNIAAQYAEFGLGGDVMHELDDSTYQATQQQPSLIALRRYLLVYPNGMHAADAQAQVARIATEVSQAEAAGQRALPGFSLGHARGPSGPDADSFGAIALSRSTWHVAFATDYPSP